MICGFTRIRSSLLRRLGYSRWKISGIQLNNPSLSSKRSDRRRISQGGAVESTIGCVAAAPGPLPGVRVRPLTLYRVTLSKSIPNPGSIFSTAK